MKVCARTINSKFVQLLTIAALTPIERWQAVRRLHTSFVPEHLFLIAAVTALAVLIGLLLWVSYNQIMQQRRIVQQLFLEQAEKRGLSSREREILLEIASKSGLKQSDAIFTMQDAFDNGVARLIEERLAPAASRLRSKPAGAEETDQLRAELSSLREKLGFHPTISFGSLSTMRKLSSRQIPVGRTIHVTRRKAARSEPIESIVLKNDELELVAKLAIPVQSRPGEYWRVRYCFGASVLEFDTSVVRCAGDILVFNHSENIRFINRRRFLRVPVNRPALIAHFPFTTMLPAPPFAPAKQTTNRSKTSSKLTRLSTISPGHWPGYPRRGFPPGGVPQAGANKWGAPEFIPAVVVELAGPGLRLEAPLQVKIGDRVLVIISLDEQENQNEAPANGRERGPASRQHKTVSSKIVQDIAIVRHTKTTDNGLSIAVEMVGLSDSDVNELIRITNAASARKGEQGGKNPAPGSGKQTIINELVESAAAPGV